MMHDKARFFRGRLLKEHASAVTAYRMRAHFLVLIAFLLRPTVGHGQVVGGCYGLRGSREVKLNKGRVYTEYDGDDPRSYSLLLPRKAAVYVLLNGVSSRLFPNEQLDVNAKKIELDSHTNDVTVCLKALCGTCKDGSSPTLSPTP